MDGRILSEALSAGQSPTSETHKIEAGKNFSNGRWQQELKISRIGETIYLDEGNGFFEHQQ
jgi:hypothetical protein